MTAAALKTGPSVLRNAAGEPPLGADGEAFRADQGEILMHHNPAYQSPATRIGVLELQNGRWLAFPFGVDRQQYDSREAALRSGIAAMARKARRYMRNQEGQGTHWTEGYAGRVIEWALSLKAEKKPLVQVASMADAAPIDHPGTAQGADLLDVLANPDRPISDAGAHLREGFAVGDKPAFDQGEGRPARPDPLPPSDPVVAELVAAHRLRKQFPAKHTISMTTAMVNGQFKNIGTCACGVVMSHSNYEHLDAAIEAHWRRFSYDSMVDGRGQPIKPGDASRIPSAKKPRKKKSEPGTGGHPVPNVADAPDPHALRSEPALSLPPDGAGSLIQAAPIGAGTDDDDLSIEWPSYDAFLDQKIVTAPMRGIEVPRDALHPWLKPHCKDLTVWALRLGCAAIFANFGLHKTAMQLEWVRQLVKHTGQPSLCVVPLGVRHGFVKEALQLGMDVRFIRTTEELDDLYCEGVRHFLTNYESVRDGKLDPNQFAAVSLDEASVLRSYGSKTFQEFLPLFSKVEFKLVATATPSPNRYKELIHYAGFLGVMDTGLALTRWFQRNSEKAGDLTLYPHKEEEFWMWVHSWAAFLQRPSELGYSDEGYELPPLKLTWHEVPADHTQAEPERDGQGVMFRAVASSLQDAAKSRRDSLAPRIARMTEIIAQDPASHRIIWHDLEAEREAIEKALPEVVTISGSMDIDDREVRLHDFEEGRTKYFGTKPILSGSGSNFQYHCHKAIYVALPGYGYKFNDFIQSLYRLQRFGQEHPVEVDIIYSEDERAGRAALEEKWARDIEMRDRMSEIIKHHGLDTLPLRDKLARSIGIKRVEIKGENFTAINNDAVAECRTWPDNSVDEIITSIPFSNHYEYSASYNDFGHTDDNGHFWGQMDFLTAELLRMLKPGRLACIHVKDRVLFGSVTGEGVPTISPFHAEAIMHYRAHGFQYMGMIHVNTDVVRENNQTYRLGWSECCKDGTKMGVGSPEYVLLLRKRQSDRTKGYADVPVVKDKEAYTRARWQIDAHSFWRSSGDRFLTPEEFAACTAGDLARLFAKTSAERIYSYEAHVKIGQDVDRTGTLPATFMAIAPGATCEHTWHDVNRMRTLNMMQQRKGAEMHLCPLQFDIVDRLIERYSNEGDLIFDPFGGLMTVPYRALLKKRRGAATELNAGYFLDGVHYLRMTEEKMATPQLFDLAQFDAANTPPLTDMTEAHDAA
jgi:DNA methylase